MLAMSRIKGARVLTEDKDRGTIKDLLFDDRNSAVRYVVVDIGSWLSGKKILLTFP